MLWFVRKIGEEGYALDESKEPEFIKTQLVGWKLIETSMMN